MRSQFATFDFLFGVALGKHQGGGLIPAVSVYAKHIHVRGGSSCRAHSCITSNQCDKWEILLCFEAIEDLPQKYNDPETAESLCNTACSEGRL